MAARRDGGGAQCQANSPDFETPVVGYSRFPKLPTGGRSRSVTVGHGPRRSSGILGTWRVPSRRPPMSPRAPGRHVAAPARGRAVVCTCINRMRAPRCRSGRGLCTLPPFGAPVETSTAAITANPSNPGGAGSEPLRGFWSHMTGPRSPSACARSPPRGRCTLLCWSRVTHRRASTHAVARGFRPRTTSPADNGGGRGSSPRPIRAGLRSARIRGSNRGRRPFETPDRYVHMQICIPDELHS